MQPAFERLKGKATPGLEAMLARSQWWDAQALADWQWAEMAKLLGFAASQVPFYRDWFSAHDLSPDDVVASRDLTLLPVIDKDMLQAEPERFKPESMPAGSYAKSTGGTGGQPLHFYVSPASDHWRTAVTRRGYGWAGCPGGRRQLHLWSGDIVALPKKTLLKRDLHRTFLRQRFVDYYRMLSGEQADSALAEIDRFGPDCLVAYPSGAEALARRALARGWKPAKPLLSVLTGAERLYPHQRELIQEALGAEVFETYGGREFMLIASECPAHQGLHVSAENLMLEVAHEGRPLEPGQVGELLITDLHNFAQPFIRYTNGDLASWLEGDCPCGRGLPRLAGVSGRVMDAIRTPDGGRLTGLFFPHLLKDFEAIRRYQIVQERLDHLTLRLVLSEPLAAKDQALILEMIGQALPGVAAEIQQVEEIETTPSGKVRITIGLDDSGKGA